ncbi:MAG: DUF1573 domain-containing protein [Bacteroidales bacterium]|jgi:hypothetical protein|nr:DUF1573 domain-containing protein [Bacteroidales bacterium]
MKKITLLVSIILFIASFSYSQQKNATIIFDNEVHDFKTIQETKGKVTHKFIFTNTGNTPLIINTVKASCGCTSSEWTRRPILPGEKGFVGATYDPRNRPGKFNKTIVVRTNAVKPTVVLRITGKVTPREKTVEDIYPREIGGIRVKSNHLAFVRVYNDQVKTDSLQIINTSKEVVKISFPDTPSHLTLKTVPETLNPGEKGIILGKYDATKKNDWGFLIDRLKILINNKPVNNGRLTISAKIEENFSNLSKEELENAPQISIPEKTFNFGTAKQKSKVKHVFKFKNEGESDLLIRKIRSSCGCTTVAPEKTVIKSGESSSFTAIFSTSMRKGLQRKSIYLITNDPKNSNIRLTISGEVEP